MDNQTTIQEIAELTERNQHSEAIIKGCKMIGAREGLIESAEMILSEHKREGYLTEFLRGSRNVVYCRMMEEAKRVLNKKDLQAFHQAF